MGKSGSIELRLEKIKPERAQGIFVFGSFTGNNMDKNSMAPTFDSAGSVSSLEMASVNLNLLEHNAKILKMGQTILAYLSILLCKNTNEFFYIFQILICIIYWVQNSSVKQSDIYITLHIY